MTSPRLLDVGAEQLRDDDVKIVRPPSVEDEVARDFEEMANPARTLAEIRAEDQERRDRQLSKGLDPVRSATVKRAKPVDHRGRTATYFRKRGYNYAPCQTVGYMGQSQDLLGFLDALAFKAGEPLIGVQICSTGDAQAHIRKMCSLELDKRSHERRVDNLRALLGSGCRVMVLEWQRRPVGQQTWWPVEHWVTEASIEAVEGRRRK